MYDLRTNFGKEGGFIYEINIFLKKAQSELQLTLSKSLYDQLQ